MIRKIGILAPEPLRQKLADELYARGVNIAFLGDCGSGAIEQNGTGEQQSLRAFLNEAPHDLIVAEPIQTISAQLLRICDERGVRIIPLCAREDDRRFAQSTGLIDSLSLELEFWDIIQSLLELCTGTGHPRDQAPALNTQGSGITIAVWGPHGAPGRSTIAREVAIELKRLSGASLCLIDADTHAPSQALSLGKLDEGPGIATACRAAAIGTLDISELDRIMQATHFGADVEISFISGINRAARWNEVGEAQLHDVISAAKRWRQITVIDMAAALERDEEIVSDLDGFRRNAASISTLQAADLVIAVGLADPVGITRLSRGLVELRDVIGKTPVITVINRLRSGAIGLNAKKQIRSALNSYVGVSRLSFIPEDQRSVDLALSEASVTTTVAPRGPLARSITEFCQQHVLQYLPQRQSPEARGVPHSRARMRRKERV